MLSRLWRRTHHLYGSVPAQGIIDLRNIVKVYDTAAGPFTALKGIDLTVQAGEFVAVVGKSGSGKSTLINMFTGIDHPTEGEVIVANTPIRHLDEGRDGRVARAAHGHHLPVLSTAAHALHRRKRHDPDGPGRVVQHG